MPKSEWAFDAIGAPWAITTATELSETTKTAILARIQAFDAVYSRFRSDSLVSRIAQAPGQWTLPDDAAPLLSLYRTLYYASEGAMSPLVGSRLENLGYDAEYTLTPRDEAVEVPTWEEVLDWDGSTLTTSSPVLLDVGAAGKGYLVDLVAEVLGDAGVETYVIDASGDILHRGNEPLRVGLEHPFDPTLAIGVCELQNASICASAPNRRAWGNGLHHILDATTGEPTTTVSATWAVAPTGLVADGLATALFFAAAPALSASYTFDYVRMFPNLSVEYSRTFPGELFNA